MAFGRDAVVAHAAGHFRERIGPAASRRSHANETPILAPSRQATLHSRNAFSLSTCSLNESGTIAPMGTRMHAPWVEILRTAHSSENVSFAHTILPVRNVRSRWALR